MRAAYHEHGPTLSGFAVARRCARVDTLLRNVAMERNMKHRPLFAICAILALAGCDREPVGTNATGNETTTTAAQDGAQTAVQPTPAVQRDILPAEPVAEVVLAPFDKADLPGGLDVKGEVVGGTRFTDGSGDHVVVLSQVPDTLDLHALLASIDAEGKPQDVHRVHQLRGDCEFDYAARFVDGALAATDVDEDGIAEVTIAYKYSCASDVGPSDYKVVVLEGSEKATLQGGDIVLFPGQSEPDGNGKFEAEGFEGSPKLLDHAERVWKRNVLTRL